MIGAIASEQLVRPLARKQHDASTIPRELAHAVQREARGITHQVVVQLDPTWQRGDELIAPSRTLMMLGAETLGHTSGERRLIVP